MSFESGTLQIMGEQMYFIKLFVFKYILLVLVLLTFKHFAGTLKPETLCHRCSRDLKSQSKREAPLTFFIV